MNEALRLIRDKLRAIAERQVEINVLLGDAVIGLEELISPRADHDCKLDVYGLGHCDNPVHGEEKIPF